MKSSKGFVSLYLLTVLAVCLMVSHGIFSEMSRYYRFQSEREVFRKMNWIEVLAIKRAIQSYRCYSESDETVYIDGYSVSFRYQDLSCTITIRGNGHLRVRTLVFDDIEDEVIDYQ